MAFKNAQSSHEHSKYILDLLYGYDSFLDSLTVVADFGCGAGLDAEWWATLTTRDVPPVPRNYIVYAIDKDISQVASHVNDLPNVHLFQADFDNDRVIPRACDLLWSHDSFQYSTNPLQTLKFWNQQLNTNGMLMLSLPQSTFNEYNRQQSNSYSGVYYNYNLVTLMYMLAVSGFDCRDAYFYKPTNDPWVYAAVYKTSEPLDLKTTNWHTLVDLNVVNDSVKAA